MFEEFPWELLTAVCAGAVFLGCCSSISGTLNLYSNQKDTNVSNKMSGYANLFDGARSKVGTISSDKSILGRKLDYETMVNSFYDLVTTFYQYGWGNSFHFAPRYLKESFNESIARAEHFLAMKLQLKQNDVVLDMGCGIGGPMRNIARFSKVKRIEGITINQHQVDVGNRYNKDMGLDGQCNLQQGDFMKMPYEDNTFDAVYAIEATCHAPDKTKCFEEAFRVMKPGAMFTGYEWLMVGNYDSENPEHVRIKEGIEVGNGLPTLETPKSLESALTAAGFEIVEHFDANGEHSTDPQQLPWFEPLNGSMSLTGFRTSYVGRYCTHFMVKFLEAIKVAPAGSVKVSEMLIATADDLVDAGKLGIMTPSYYFLAKKPE